MGNERIKKDERKFAITSNVAFNKAYETLEFY